MEIRGDVMCLLAIVGVIDLGYERRWIFIFTDSLYEHAGCIKKPYLLAHKSRDIVIQRESPVDESRPAW